MIKNVFLLKWVENESSNAVNSSDMRGKIGLAAAYPTELEFLKDPQKTYQLFLNKKRFPRTLDLDKLNNYFQAQVMDSYNLLSVLFLGKYIIGITLEKSDNPWDYREILKEVLEEFFIPMLKDCVKKKRKMRSEDISNILLSLFIEIKKWESEHLEIDKEERPRFYPSQNLNLKVFIFGIDNAGKSSYVRRIRTGKYDKNYFPPSKSFEIKELEIQGMTLVFWVMPGQDVFLAKWGREAQASNLIVFLLDTADKERYPQAKKAFQYILSLYDLKNVPLLFLANKIDLLSATDEDIKEELTDYFELNELIDRKWKFVFLSVEKNIGVNKTIQIYSNYVEELQDNS